MKRLIKSILTIAAIAAISLSATARTSYRGLVDIDPTIAISYSSVNPSECTLYDKPADFNVMFTTTHGVQLNRHFFIGAGAGFILGTSDGKARRINPSQPDSETATELNLYVPAFVAARWDWNIAAKVSPFVSCKLGYSLGVAENGSYNVVGPDGYGVGALEANSGFFYQPTVGVRFRLHHHVGLNLGLTLYPSYYKTDVDDGGQYGKGFSATYSRLNFGLNLGIDF